MGKEVAIAMLCQLLHARRNVEAAILRRRILNWTEKPGKKRVVERYMHSFSNVITIVVRRGWYSAADVVADFQLVHSGHPELLLLRKTWKLICEIEKRRSHA